MDIQRMHISGEVMDVTLVQDPSVGLNAYLHDPDTGTEEAENSYDQKWNMDKKILTGRGYPDRLWTQCGDIFHEMNGYRGSGSEVADLLRMIEMVSPF